MKLWKIERPGSADYDQYDAAVVAAETEEAARNTHPDGWRTWDGQHWEGERSYTSWVRPEQVVVTELARARRGTKAGVIVASFNAG